MRVAIVGHASDKFTDVTEEKAHDAIRSILDGHRIMHEVGQEDEPILVSGGCHLGGVDIFAEFIADALGIQKEIYYPKTQKWEGGYKQRNLQIAEACDVAWCIVVADYPEGYNLRKFGARDGKPYCYHCNTDTHVKSGGCWTVKKAEKMSKPANWHIIGGE